MTAKDNQRHGFGTGMLNHNEGAAPDSVPAQPAPEQPVTTLVSTALGPKMPPFTGDSA